MELGLNIRPASINTIDIFSFANAFTNSTNDIRVVTINGEPWFVAKDVLSALSLYIYAGKPNVTMALRKLARDESKIVKRDGVNSIYPWPFDPRAAGARLVSESGLYKLIMRSDKPQARPFQDWVTKDVIPAIRKDGMYVRGEEKVKTGEMSLEEMSLAVVNGLQAVRSLDKCETALHPIETNYRGGDQR